MSNLEFIKKLYNGKNCYSDHMSSEELQLLYVHSNIEDIVVSLLNQNKIVFLTGNPGDGKTFLIKTIESRVSKPDLYIETDYNRVSKSDTVVETIIHCYETNCPAIIAINEYPFIRLCKQIKQVSKQIYDEMMRVKDGGIIYGFNETQIKRIAIINLNDRNLLDLDHKLTEEVILRVCELLNEDDYKSKQLEYNIVAMMEPEIRNQLISILNLASIAFNHFSVRDILGTVAFIITACESDDYNGMPYYDAVFSGTNTLLEAIKLFDPVLLSCPKMDEDLWNGVIRENWKMGLPEKWPNDEEFDNSVEKATILFKSIKRKYFFENSLGKELNHLQPREIVQCVNYFNNLENNKKNIKEKLIRSINKLFLPSSDDRKKLRIWTTHRYDLSIDISTAVSGRYIDSSSLDLKMPKPALWLKGLEYTPRCLLLTPKDKAEPVLPLDIDFLRTLEAVERGYPVSLLSPQYAQAASLFLHQLDNTDLVEENEDGEIIIASRKKSYKRSLYIRDGKYLFEEEE